MGDDKEFNAVAVQVAGRQAAWKAAEEMVIPIIEKHDLDNYEINGNFLVKGSTMTKVDQHIDHILRVADWLLEPVTR